MEMQIGIENARFEPVKPVCKGGATFAGTPNKVALSHPRGWRILQGERGDGTMIVKAETVRAMNEAYAGLALKAARAEELPIELNQFRSAIEAVARTVDFDVDPFDFRAALVETARGMSE